MLIPPHKGLALVRDFEQRACYLSEVLNESQVVVGKAHECSHLKLLKSLKSCEECSLRSVLECNLDLPVTTGQVQSIEVLHSI